jgi:hypothetical protein
MRSTNARIGLDDFEGGGRVERPPREILGTAQRIEVTINRSRRRKTNKQA